MINIKVQQCGLFVDPLEPYYIGALPDGLIEEDGIIEVKCPKNSTRLSPMQAMAVKNFKSINFA